MSYPCDPGLQPERTLLAWRRTCLGLVVNSFLLMRGGALHGEPAAIGAGLLVIVLAGWLYARVRTRLRCAPGDCASSPDRLALMAAAGAALLVCLAGAWHGAALLHAAVR
ncbi:DUF202 domain-containing protein [Achromobacter insuavis]|uniref:DUF202 domain-containing protein n=1 Tax=Achromobacter insuavis TaxID=1287735 RepID=UPI000AAA00FD|nr:DUF202 domain-containing protein [Achromobacter insuavis]